MISALVVVLATFVFVSASPVAERQSCTIAKIPSQCTQAGTDYQRGLAQVVANPSSMTAQQIRDLFMPLLNTLCGSTCLSPTVNNLRCAGQSALVNFTLTGICGKNGNTFCPIEVFDLGISGTSLIPTCASSGTCPSSCRETLTTIANRLGCCAASWYTNNASPLFQSVGNQFRTCQVSAGRVCPAAGAGSTTAHYLSALLLIVASALAIVVL